MSIENSTEIKWTIIICTHNRSQDLKETLLSVSKLVYPANAFEILVVDNASEDDTRHVVKNAAADSVNIKYLREEKLGLSYARNTGLKNAQGELVAFLDDDAAPDPYWLDKLQSYFEDPKTACVGGMVKPVWQKQNGWPSWLHSRLFGYFTVIDYSTPRELVYPLGPAGTNIAFRKEIFRETGSFNPRLGRTGPLLLSGEEADLCVAIKQAGYSIMYTPEAVVWHKVHENRLTRDWVMERSYWGGVSSAIIERRRFGVLNFLFKTIKYLVLILASIILEHFFLLIKNERQMFFWKCQKIFSKSFLKNLWFPSIH